MEREKKGPFHLDYSGGTGPTNDEPLRGGLSPWPLVRWAPLRTPPLTHFIPLVLLSSPLSFLPRSRAYVSIPLLVLSFSRARRTRFALARSHACAELAIWYSSVLRFDLPASTQLVSLFDLAPFSPSSSPLEFLSPTRRHVTSGWPDSESRLKPPERRMSSFCQLISQNLQPAPQFMARERL